MNRRQVLAGLSAAVVACNGDPAGGPPPPGDGPAPARPPEPAPWDAPGIWDDVAFAWGVAAGDPQADGALLWTRTTEPTVTLVVMRAEGDTWVEASRQEGVAVTDEVAQLEVTGLEPDTAHQYVFTAGTRRSVVGRFRTAPLAGAFRQVVFGATSCLATDGDPGLPCLRSVPGAALDAFLLLGDTVYADGARTVDDYRAFWREIEATPSYRDAIASAAVVATWDDHEVENNWTLREADPTQTQISQAQLDAGLQAFREAMPMRRGPGGSGLWRAVRFGPVDLFVTDCRSERTETELVSAGQLDWLRAELEASEAVFKVVLVSVHLTDHAAVMGPIEALDRWQGYPAQRDALLAVAEQVPGVLFVTGDMHFGAIQQVGATGDAGATLYEIAAGPAGSELFLLDQILALASPEVRAQYLDLLEDWNWARFTADPGTRTVRVELLDGEGVVVVSRVLAL